MRRIATLAATIAVLLIPLMGAKGCGTSNNGSASTGSGQVVIPLPKTTFHPGQEVRAGDHVWWIGQVPPASEPGYAWAPDGYTGKNHRPVWIKVPG